MSLTLSPLAVPKTQNGTERHWTAEEFYRAAAQGQFTDPDRLELVHGRLIRLMQGERHANLTARLSRRLRRALDPPFFAREEKPIHIAFDGEPIPDLMMTYEEGYAGRHPEPQDVALLVEVADTSVEYDLGEKALLYAQAGIEDYWVVLVAENAVVVHRDPDPNGYRSVVKLVGLDTISPLATPNISWTITKWLGVAEIPKEN